MSRVGGHILWSWFPAPGYYDVEKAKRQTQTVVEEEIFLAL